MYLAVTDTLQFDKLIATKVMGLKLLECYDETTDNTSYLVFRPGVDSDYRPLPDYAQSPGEVMQCLAGSKWEFDFATDPMVLITTLTDKEGRKWASRVFSEMSVSEEKTPNKFDGEIGLGVGLAALASKGVNIFELGEIRYIYNGGDFESPNQSDEQLADDTTEEETEA